MKVLYFMAAATGLLILRPLLEYHKINFLPLARDFVAFNIAKISQQNEDDLSLRTIESPTTRVPMYMYEPTFPWPVYYVWCHPRKRSFEFRNYLSVMSVLQNIKPDSVIFFYSEYPVIDVEEYNTWLDDIRLNSPSFQTRKAPAQACLSYERVNRAFIDMLLNKYNGLYVNENTVVTSNSSSELLEFCRFRSDNTSEPRILCSPTNSTTFAASKQLPECFLASEMANQTDIPFCLIIDRSIYPKHIWTYNDVLSRVSRKIFYGSEDVPAQPKPSYTELAPNIAHMVWMGGGDMDFLFYLGVLSLVYVAGVDKVFVHGDLPPTGYYWSLIANETRVEYVPHEPVTMIYGMEVRSFQHMSDILRVKFMVNQGGIYLDTDAVFVKPLDRRIRAYDAVATIDWWDSSHPFPEIINFGVSVGKKGAKYWLLFQESMHNFGDKTYTLNGLRRPYKIMERHPGLLFIEPRLQLQCYKLKCHPTWINDFHNPDNHHLNPSVKIDWKTDVYTYHRTTPTPMEFSSFQTLLKANGTFAEIGKYILRKSGMMDFFFIINRTMP